MSISVISSTLHGFFAYWYCEFDVCSSYVFISFLFISVSSVLQPCRTCHMLFVLLARCVVCVVDDDDDDDDDDDEKAPVSFGNYRKAFSKRRVSNKRRGLC